MADYEELKKLIAERGLKQRFIAQKIGVSDTRMHRLLTGGQWKLDEVVAICRLLSLTKKQRDDIFFSHEVGV